MRKLPLLALLAAAMLASAASARAEGADDQSQCVAASGVAPEQKLTSCTAAIAAGTPAAGVAASHDLAVLYANRGNAYLNKHDLDHALGDFEAAIKLDPQYILPLDGRGLVYQNRGQLDRAIADFDHAVALEPENRSRSISAATPIGQRGATTAPSRISTGRSPSIRVLPRPSSTARSPIRTRPSGTSTPI